MAKDRGVGFLASYEGWVRQTRSWTFARKLVYKFIPQPLFRVLLFELRTATVRWQSRNRAREYASKQDLLVNLGAGNLGKQGWVNVDVIPKPGVNCVYDCRKSLPFPDGSVRCIFTEHFLEHLDYVDEVPALLSECHRSLKPGGIIRIVVPDAGKDLRGYCEDGWQGLSSLRAIYSDQGQYATKIELINAVFRQGFQHKFAYDYETLKYVLERSGFTQVRQQAFGQSLLP